MTSTDNEVVFFILAVLAICPKNSHLIALAISHHECVPISGRNNNSLLNQQLFSPERTKSFYRLSKVNTMQPLTHFKDSAYSSLP